MWEEDVEGQENFPVSAGFELATLGLLVQGCEFKPSTECTAHAHIHTHLEPAHGMEYHDGSVLDESRTNGNKLAYDSITQKCLRLVRSPCLQNFLPQSQLSVLNSDCLLAEQVFHRLDVEIFCTPSKHK